MPKGIDIISARLGERNRISVEIDQFVKDMSYAVDRETCVAPDGLKTALYKLGGKECLLD